MKIDPRGRPTNFKCKQCSILARLWVWPSGSLMSYLFCLVYFEKWGLIHTYLQTYRRTDMYEYSDHYRWSASWIKKISDFWQCMSCLILGSSYFPFFSCELCESMHNSHTSSRPNSAQKLVQLRMSFVN